jgi:hypothetical protein
VKVGVDDYLAAGGTLEQLDALAAPASVLDESPLRGRIEFVELAQLLATEPAPAQWVWHGYIERGCLTLLHGQGGLGKSVLVFALAREAARGGELLGWPVTRSRVLYLDGENPTPIIHRRLFQLGFSSKDTVAVAFGQVRDAIFNDLDDAEQELIELITASASELVLLDSQRALWPGDEREAGEVRAFYSMLRRVAEATGAAIVVVHHDNKAGGYSGSTDLNASVDIRLHIDRPRKTDKPADPARMLACEKTRNGHPPTLEFDLVWDDETSQLQLCLTNQEASAAGSVSRNVSRAASFIRERGRATTKEIANAVGVKPRSVRYWRDDLASVGIDSDRAGEWWPRQRTTSEAEAEATQRTETPDASAPQDGAPSQETLFDEAGSGNTSASAPFAAETVPPPTEEEASAFQTDASLREAIVAVVRAEPGIDTVRARKKSAQTISDFYRVIDDLIDNAMLRREPDNNGGLRLYPTTD